MVGLTVHDAVEAHRVRQCDPAHLTNIVTLTMLSYHDCLMWAYRHKMDPQNRKSAVRIKRDKQRGGWKCCVTLYTR